MNTWETGLLIASGGKNSWSDSTRGISALAWSKAKDLYEHADEYERTNDPKKLEELGHMISSLDAGDSIAVTKYFTHMLNLANLAEEVQISHPKRVRNLKKGNLAKESLPINESDIEQTLRRLIVDLKIPPQEVFETLKNQTVELVFTAHPTQSVRRSLLQKHARSVIQFDN
uniref:Phosphoenolpyruvate carboxylase n=1 Tax=Opuntia streptacantha TaxID=393608 RepID=A0A7C9D1R8_OPUST